MSDQEIKTGLGGWFREGVWVAIGLAGSVLALVVGTRILTTLLTTEEYGKLALSISLATLAVQMGATPIAQTIVRFFTHRQIQGKLAHLIRNLSWYFGCITVAIVVVIFSLTILRQLRWVDLPSASFLLLIGLFALQMVINRVAFAFEDAMRARRIRSLFQLSFEVTRFTLAIVFIFLFGQKSATYALLGFVLAGVFIVIAHIVYLGQRLKRDIYDGYNQATEHVHSDTVEVRKFLFPLIITYGSIWIFMMAERWIIQYSCNLSEVGGYSAVYQLAFMPMTLVSNFLLILSTPIIYQMIGVDNKTVSSSNALKINRYLAGSVFFFSLLVCFLLLKFHTFAGWLLLGEDFRQYSWMFPWLFLSGGCFAASQQLLLQMTCEFRTFRLSVFWVVMATIALFMYVISAHYWQLPGIFFSVISVNGLLLVVSFLFTFRTVDKKILQ